MKFLDVSYTKKKKSWFSNNSNEISGFELDPHQKLSVVLT